MSDSTQVYFTDQQMDIILWAAKECEHQQSGEMSVFRMLNAWQYAIGYASSTLLPTEFDILTIGALVEPIVNCNGWRTTPVQIGDKVLDQASLIPRQINNLLEATNLLTPDEWFKHFEEIHPFADGNGRTGVILYNWLKGRLHCPMMAPDFWKES